MSVGGRKRKRARAARLALEWRKAAEFLDLQRIVPWDHPDSKAPQQSHADFEEPALREEEPDCL